jgi:hypothetical protein
MVVAIDNYSPFYKKPVKDLYSIIRVTVNNEGTKIFDYIKHMNYYTNLFFKYNGYSKIIKVEYGHSLYLTEFEEGSIGYQAMHCDEIDRGYLFLANLYKQDQKFWELGVPFTRILGFDNLYHPRVIGQNSDPFFNSFTYHNAVFTKAEYYKLELGEIAQPVIECVVSVPKPFLKEGMYEAFLHYSILFDNIPDFQIKK